MYQKSKQFLRQLNRVKQNLPQGKIGIIIVIIFLTLAYVDGEVPGQVYELQPGFYRVTHVSDGDTIEVKKDGVKDRVRLIGIDTPETHHPDKPVQCFGVQATQYARTAIQKQANQVKLVADPLNDNRDRYGRLVRYVYLKDGSLLNAEIVKNGYGFSYNVFAYEKSDEFNNYEQSAMRNNRGLWNHCEVSTSQFVKETVWP